MFIAHKWQQKCISALAYFRFLSVVVHRQGGKTKLAITRLVKEARANTTILPHYAYVAPLKNQAVQVAWERLKKELRDYEKKGYVKFREKDFTATFTHNGAIIQVFGGSDPDALRGLTLDGIVMDEVAQMHPKIWDEVLQAELSIKMGWVLFIGTPKGADLFYDVYNRAFDAENEDWKSFKFNVYETETINPKEIARLKRELSPEVFAREFMCDFNIAGDSQLISLEACSEATQRAYQFSDIRQKECLFGVDVARYGRDNSVISIRQGQKVLGYKKYHHLNSIDLANEIIRQKEEFYPDRIFIDAGAGAGVIDILRDRGVDVVEVHFAGRADQPELYQNKRAEMYFRMKFWIESTGQIPADTPLMKELATPNYFYNPANKRQIEKKEEIKLRIGGSSPDIADALALTFTYADSERETGYTKMKNESDRLKELDYNPLEKVS